MFIEFTKQLYNKGGQKATGCQKNIPSLRKPDKTYRFVAGPRLFLRGNPISLPSHSHFWIRQVIS
jgi:hypothetical protein